MTIRDLEGLLRKHDFLHGLTAEQTRVLVGCVRNVRYREGELLMREGRRANVFYLIRAGRISLEIDVPGRGPVQMETLGAGDVLGLSWLIPPYREHLDARAAEPVLALAFDAACLRDKLAADHELGYVLLARMLEHAYRRLVHVRLQRVDMYGLP
ncbi:MAG: cyclic nucleotide-binding domain-containing protein [Deltaproteobacteria bacterium]|nr:cyclic nucleotide-binding domain-containing protein [Deltaproteobacteria bacterium]